MGGERADIEPFPVAPVVLFDYRRKSCPSKRNMTSLLYQYIVDPLFSLFSSEVIPPISEEEDSLQNVWSSERANKITEIAIKALDGRSVTVLEYACNDVPFDYIQRKDCERFVARDSNTKYNGVHVQRMTERILRECLSRPSVEEGALWFLCDGDYIRDPKEAAEIIDKVALLDPLPTGVSSSLEILGVAADGELLVWTNPDPHRLLRVKSEILKEKVIDDYDILGIPAKESKCIVA